MSRRIRIAALCSLLLFSAIAVTGCWDLRYLDRMGVVLAVGVDKDPTERYKMRVTVQVVLPQRVASKDSGGGGAPVMTVTDSGDTLFEAFRKMTAKTSRRLFFSHAQLLIVGESMAREGIYPLLDLIERNPEIRTNSYVLNVRGSSALQILQLTTTMEQIPASQIHQLVEVTQEAQGGTYPVTVQELTRIGSSQQFEQALIPTLEIEGDKSQGNTLSNIEKIKPSAFPKVVTMAALRDGKLIGYLNRKESRGIGWLKNKIKNTVVKIPCPDLDGYISMEIGSSSVEVKAKQTDSPYPEMNMKIHQTGSMHEIMCPNVNVYDEKVLEEASRLTEEAVKSEVNAAIQKVQKQMRVDVLEWGHVVYQQQPRLWKKIHRDWEQIYPKVKHKVEVITTITDAGVRGESVVK
ncbi:Ger(x)C family spore germination protein [Paenibacillus sp. GCM10023252]|uniref:Ger(x)C family spore germination protein n=1 Tax=Paenibacillus sp. GCM10023252 TaxID=3252649 RepID=UPI00360E6442